MPGRFFTEQYAGTPYSTLPAPAKARRSRRPVVLLVVGIVALVAAAGSFLALRAANPPSSGLSTGAPTTPAEAFSTDCIIAMTPLVTGLEDLDSRLSVGLNFSDYSQKVGDLKVAHDKIKPSTLDLQCLSGLGSPAETALNDYIHAYNTWNDCIGKVGCTNATIKSSLQADWAKATTIISGLRAAMP
jgi:hypothetical protein